MPAPARSARSWRLPVGLLGLGALVASAGCLPFGDPVGEAAVRGTPATPAVLFLGISDQNVTSSLAVPSPYVLVVRSTLSPEPSPTRLTLATAP